MHCFVMWLILQKPRNILSNQSISGSSHLLNIIFPRVENKPGCVEWSYCRDYHSSPQKYVNKYKYQCSYRIVEKAIE